MRYKRFPPVIERQNQNLSCRSLRSIGSDYDMVPEKVFCGLLDARYAPPIKLKLLVRVYWTGIVVHIPVAERLAVSGGSVVLLHWAILSGVRCMIRDRLISMCS